MGDGAKYPADAGQVDQTIPLFYVSPGIGSSGGGWTTLRAQAGRFPKGHFGPEVSMARALGKAGYHPAVFKYTLGATGLARNWKAPGDKGLYDGMVEAYGKARTLLEQQGHAVQVRAFIWIQGESDGATKELAEGYYNRLKTLLADLIPSPLDSRYKVSHEAFA